MAKVAKNTVSADKHFQNYSRTNLTSLEQDTTDDVQMESTAEGEEQKKTLLKIVGEIRNDCI